MPYIFLVAALLLATPACAGEITVSASWARATAPGQDNGAVYLRIISQQEARIVAVSSSAAASAEMHSMTHDNGIMKMRELAILPLPARQQVELRSGGSHIMLIGLKQALKVGDRVPLTLTIQFADKHQEKVEVKAEVRALTAGNNARPQQHDH